METLECWWYTSRCLHFSSHTFVETNKFWWSNVGDRETHVIRKSSKKRIEECNKYIALEDHILSCQGQIVEEVNTSYFILDLTHRSRTYVLNTDLYWGWLIEPSSKHAHHCYTVHHLRPVTNLAPSIPFPAPPSPHRCRISFHLKVNRILRFLLNTRTKQN